MSTSTVVILILLLAVGFSLGSAVFYLVRDRGTTDRTVRSLTWRTLLSVGLFLVLMIGAFLGFFGAR